MELNKNQLEDLEIDVSMAFEKDTSDFFEVSEDVFSSYKEKGQIYGDIAIREEDYCPGYADDISGPGSPEFVSCSILYKKENKVFLVEKEEIMERVENWLLEHYQKFKYDR